jgi:hypothetical protein
MDAKTKYKKQTDQFKINVNNIVVMLLKNNSLFNKRSATREAICLIMSSLGCKQRQAKDYLKAAREEILKVSEIQKVNAINQAIETGRI